LETKDKGRRTIEIRRARRGDIPAVAALVQKASRSKVPVDEAEVMDWLFGKGMLVANEGNKLVGVAAWQTENLLSVTDVFYVSPARLREEAGGGLLSAIEAEVNVLMCEANVMLLPAGTPKAVLTFLQGQGYQPKEFEELHRIWREVLNDLGSGELDLMVKRLRERMVMAPV
jgi:N-acetylglutamate synthase-like GNAT family acetyltransferase